MPIRSIMTELLFLQCPGRFQSLLIWPPRWSFTHCMTSRAVAFGPWDSLTGWRMGHTISRYYSGGSSEAAFRVAEVLVSRPIRGFRSGRQRGNVSFQMVWPFSEVAVGALRRDRHMALGLRS